MCVMSSSRHALCTSALTSPSGPGRMESMPKCTMPCLASHSVAATLTPGLSVGIGRRREGARMMARAEQNRAALRDRHARLRHRRFEIGRRDLGPRLDVPQVDADARHDAVLERILVDRRARLGPKWRGASICVPPWSGIEKYMTLLPCTLPESANASACVFQTP